MWIRDRLKSPQKITSDGRSPNGPLEHDSREFRIILCTDIHVDIVKVCPHMAQHGTEVPSQTLGQNQQKQGRVIPCLA